MSATVALEVAPIDSADKNEQVTEGREESATTADRMQAEIEPKEAKEEEEQQENESTLTPRPTTSSQVPRSQREREIAAERIRQSSSLPPVLKERLAALVGLNGEADAGGKHRVPIDEAIRAIEEALPDFLRMDKGLADQPEHPGGDVFFSGEAGELSDAQAEELARGQLARSGLLRGQRARVAVD
jgi:hypothetical protein